MNVLGAKQASEFCERHRAIDVIGSYMICARNMNICLILGVYATIVTKDFWKVVSHKLCESSYCLKVEAQVIVVLKEIKIIVGSMKPVLYCKLFPLLRRWFFTN